MQRGEGIYQLVGAVYGAAVDAGRWPSVLEQFARVFGASSAHLSEDNLASTQGRLVSYGFDPGLPDLYTRYYASRNVLWKNIVQRSLDGVLTDRIIMPREQLVRSEFYNDFLQPQGGEEVLCFAGKPHEGVCMNLILAREQRHGMWGAKDMKAMATVAPHVNRALAINRQIAAQLLFSNLATEALHRLNCGTILVDAKGSVLFVNPAAERLFSERDFRLSRRYLATGQPSDTAALRRLIALSAQSGVGGAVVVPRRSRTSLLVSAIPLQGSAIFPSAGPRGVILFVKELDSHSCPDLTNFARYFKLTAAETTLAAELTKADGVYAAAQRIGISRATARTHLIHIFRKTATKRQVELVRLMLTWGETPAYDAHHA